VHAENYGLGIVSQSAKFDAVLSLIKRLARYTVSVLIHGETGTGKELLARLLHYSGSRAGHPFVPINAGALVDSLVENELFGHAPGAFTDARGRSQGLVELASGGTLFLDEIDALGAHGQAALLRFLEDGRYRAIGSTRESTADVRTIAATNADPKALLEDGRVRKDLYFRLAGVTVSVPALRDRRDDILPLARHFLADLNAQARVGVLRLGPEFTGWLLAQDWPGNVRELKSAVEYAYIMCDGDTLLPPAAEEEAGSPAVGSFRAEKASAISAFERAYLSRIMQECDGNVSRAARAADKERKGFDRLLKRHGIERRSFLPDPS
jgi:two-component system, NtrC family, response regulator GlrR